VQLQKISRKGLELMINWLITIHVFIVVNCFECMLQLQTKKYWKSWNLII